MDKSIVYLAVPYTHPDKFVIQQRFDKVNKVSARLMSEGINVFSPISHTHPIALAGSLPTNWEFWKNYDMAFLSCSKKLIVLQLDGWENSVGVQAEIQIAKNLGLPIEYIKE
jgi:hypothetical protein